MGAYATRVLPRIIDRGMRNRFMEQQRGRVAPLAAGRVLELGAGAGLNLPYYRSRVTHLFALEPADVLRARAGARAEAAPFPVTLLATGAEGIPLEDAAVDTVVSTWTLCSIPDLATALAEVRRVLRPGGRLLFLEHGRSPEPRVARRQDRVAPLMRHLAGCNPNRPIDAAISASGFRFASLERTYLDGPRLLAFHYIGVAEPA